MDPAWQAVQDHPIVSRRHRRHYIYSTITICHNSDYSSCEPPEPQIPSGIHTRDHLSCWHLAFVYFVTNLSVIRGKCGNIDLTKASKRSQAEMNNDRQSRWEAPPRPPPDHGSSSSSSSKLAYVGGIGEEDGQRRGFPMITTTTSTTSVCKFFLRGDCKHGTSCRFSHHQQQQQQQQQHPNDQHQQRRGYSMDGSNRNSLFYFSLMLCLHYDVFAPNSNIDVILYN